MSDEEKQKELTDETEEAEDVEDAATDEEGAATDLTDKVKLFNRWSFKGVKVDDISLANYINIRPIIVPHTGGKHQHKRFWKTEHVSVIERFINKILTPGLVSKRIKGRGASHNMGKKQKILQIIYNAFAIVEAKTSENPIQVLVKAIENAAPREETTRISMGGISYQQAVDIAPQRRVDLGIKIIVQSVVGTTFNNVRTIDELLGNELVLCARNDNNSRAIKRKDELERVAISAR